MSQYRRVQVTSSTSDQREGPIGFSQARTTNVRSSNGQVLTTTFNSRTNLANSRADNRNVEWEGEQGVVLSGETDFAILKHTKQLLMQLLGEFGTHGKVVFEGDYKDEFNRRLLLLEHELEGTMRRGIGVTEVDAAGGKRTLDYSKLLTEKDNELMEKENRLYSYEERMRSAEEKVIRLEIELQNLNKLLRERNGQIQHLRHQLDVRSEALDKIKLHSSLASMPEMRDILRVISMEEGGSISNSAIKNQLASLEREVNKLKSRSSSMAELDSAMEGWILGLPSDSLLRIKVEQGGMRVQEDERYKAMEEKLAVAGQIYRSQIDRLKHSNPDANITCDETIISSLRMPNTRISSTSINGVVQVEKAMTVTRQMPVSDERTRYLLRALGMHIKRLHQKYPKLKAELDVKLQEFISTELSEAVYGEELDRIIDIVRYVPQTVKVENVYAYSSKESRKVEFHLRILIKALLETMEKAKARGGIELEIDEGVIGLVRSELVDIVDVDDILRVYRPVPRIMEVPKVVEKVVDNIVRVPEKYNVSQYETKAMALQKPSMAVDEKVLVVQNPQPVPLYTEKPVELVSHSERIVSHPEVHERVAVELREKTKLQPEDRLIEKVVEREVPVNVVEEKIVIQKEIEPMEIVKEVVRYVENEKQVLKPVEVIVQKVVQKVIEKEKIVQVPQIVEKVVEVVKYEKIPEIVPHLETRVEVVKEIVQKIVPVVHVEEKIVQVPQIVEKVVTVEKVVQLPPKEIEVVKEVLKIVKEPTIVEKKVTEVIVEKQIEIREVEKIIEIPVEAQTIKVEKEIHQVPVVETIQMEKHIPVQINKNVLLREQRPVEIIKNVPHIMREEVPVPFKEEKIVPQEVFYEKIKEVPTVKEKIIEKIVEVPKVVEVEKVVEKIVTVPRVIEKVVEVPQIVQKIVEKVVQVPIEMPPVTHYVPTELTVQRPIEVDREKIVYITVDQPVHVEPEQVMVKDTETITKVEVQELLQQRVVTQRQEIPVEMHVDKIVNVPVQKAIVHTIDNVIVHPIEVPVPVTLEKTTPVYVNTETVHVQPVPHVVEKIVELRNFEKEAQVIPQIEQRVVVEQKVDIREYERPYIEKQIERVEVMEEKIVAVRDTVEQIKEVPYYIEKLVPIIQQIPKIYEFEKEPKVVFTPPTIEVVDRVVPKIINVNKYIEKIVDRLVEVPHLIREVEKVAEIHQKNVPGAENMNTQLKTVNLQVERELIREKEKIIESKVNFIEESLKTVTEVMEKDRDPVIITQDRIIEIPHVLEKIVEKIVVMPQVTEVLKYVTEIVENDELAVAGGVDLGLGVDVSVEAQEYKRLGEDLERGFADFVAELSKIKSMQPSSAQRITMLEQYLAKFRRFIKYPKIHEIIKEKVVEKDKIVKVNTGRNPSQARDDLAKVLLIERLISELSRIKRTYPDVNLQLDEDIAFIFRLNFEGKVKDVNNRLNSQLRDFEASLDKKFSRMGGWSQDHQLMLKSFLEERFVLANIVKSTNQEIRASRKQNDALAAENARLSAMMSEMFTTLVDNKNMMPDIMGALSKDPTTPLFATYSVLCGRFDEVIDHYHLMKKGETEPTRILGKQFMAEIIGSAVREKEMEIELLKEKLRTGRWRTDENAQSNVIIQNLELEIERLTHKIRELERSDGKTVRGLELEIEQLKREITRISSTTRITNNDVQVRNLEGEISRLKIVIQQNSSTQRGLQSEVERLNVRIKELLAKLAGYERELVELRRTNSPRKTIETIHSSSPHEEGRRSIVISHVERAGESEEYGENYEEYVHGDAYGAGTVQGERYEGFRSGIEQRDLSGSVATYRSGQVVTSTQHIRTPKTNVVATESARYLNESEGGSQSQYSSSTAGGLTGVKSNYKFYQKKY